MVAELELLDITELELSRFTATMTVNTDLAKV